VDRTRANNYGIGTSCLLKAGQFAAQRVTREERAASYETEDALSVRWRPFARWAQGQGVRQLEYITAHLVVAYGQEVAGRVVAGEISASHGQGLVSAVNSIMREVTRGRWVSVSPVRDCGVPRRSLVRRQAPQGVERTPAEAAIETLRDKGQHHGASVIELARELGLRTKEASLLDARAALRQARETEAVSITSGTKGGRSRVIPVSSERQLSALERAASLQNRERSLVPPGQSWAQWREGGLRRAREVLQTFGIRRIHELRAAYAAARYEELTKHPIPLLGGQASKEDDRMAREIIAEELGHRRISIMNSYIGRAP